MHNLIAEAYRENQAAARQMIDYLITSTNQQKTAAQAITLIATNALASCQTTGDVVAIAEQLSWIPAPPPAALGTVLPQFVEVSQGVRAALEATSPYRQSEMLARPIAALRRLREGLAFAPGQQAATFGGAVDRWLGILETARRTLEEQARDSTEIPQVYTPGPPLDPDSAGSRFKGRADLFRAIETLALSAQRPVLLLYGGRRTGKTSVLNYLPRRVGPEMVPLRVDGQMLGAAATLSGLAESLAAQIVEAARRSRNLRLPFPDAAHLAQDPFVALQRWLGQVEKTAGDRTLLLCLDEYERLGEVVEATGSRAPLNFLRHVMQHRPRWSLLFSGSHLLDELPAYWSDYLINTQALRVSYLSEADARDLIQQPVDGFPAIYDEETVAAIVRLTRGQPYLVQLVCYELVERLNRERRHRVELADVEAVLSAAFESGYHYFREFWEETLSPEQRQVLASLVHDGELDAGKRTVAESLVLKEVLEPAEGLYRFQVPLLQRWVEQKVGPGCPQ